MTIGALCPSLLIRRPHSNVISKYQSLVAAEKLDFDPIQLATVERLQSLQDRLDGYVPPPARSETGLLDRVSGCRAVRQGMWEQKQRAVKEDKGDRAVKRVWENRS